MAMPNNFKKRIFQVSVVALVVLLFTYGLPELINQFEVYQDRQEAAKIAELIGSNFSYHFSSSGILEESGELYKSTSPYWWLNSGGLLYIGEGLGQTIQGPLAEEQKWRREYAKANPKDTENGYYPQNLFRLFTRGQWHDLEEELFFKIENYNESNSLNRNESNGILLVGRYKDEDNLYYAGVRVDGLAVIKKKLKGTYYTLAQEKVFPGAYNRTENHNLLPLDEWIGVRIKIITVQKNLVQIELYTDVGKTGQWKLALSALDDGSYGDVIDARASAGVRSDFMDISLSSYSIKEI